MVYGNKFNIIQEVSKLENNFSDLKKAIDVPNLYYKPMYNKDIESLATILGDLQENKYRKSLGKEYYTIIKKEFLDKGYNKEKLSNVRDKIKFIKTKNRNRLDNLIKQENEIFNREKEDLNYEKKYNNIDEKEYKNRLNKLKLDHNKRLAKIRQENK